MLERQFVLQESELSDYTYTLTYHGQRRLNELQMSLEEAQQLISKGKLVRPQKSVIQEKRIKGHDQQFIKFVLCFCPSRNVFLTFQLFLDTRGRKVLVINSVYYPLEKTAVKISQRKKNRFIIFNLKSSKRSVHTGLPEAKSPHLVAPKENEDTFPPEDLLGFERSLKKEKRKRS